MATAPKPVSRFALLAILLLAAFLRFYRLDVQSLWNDEGNSARLSERSLALIVEGTASDIHPPAYYLLLHYWQALFGQSEFALRSLSVVAGLALVLFTYLLGRRLFGELSGLMAAFLGAISPFAIYYSQEARMYALLGALSAASAFVNVNLQLTERRPAIASWAAYVLVCAVGLYTHYAFAFVLIAHNVAFGLWWLVCAWRSEARWRRLVLWGGAQMAVLLLYLPWLPIALGGTSGWTPAGSGYRLGSALLDVLRVLTVGVTLPIEAAKVTLAGAGLLLLAGLWPSSGEERAPWTSVAEASVYLVIPVTLFFAFDLYKPAWLKFLVVALPPFHVLVAQGVETLACLASRASRFALHALRNTQYTTRTSDCVARTLAVLALAALILPSLHNLYFDPAYARDDYRQIVADIRAMRRPDDAIVLNAPNQWEVFTYYYPDRDVYPAPYRPSLDGAERFLTPILEEHERLFVLYWGDAESDPHRRIESWLASHAYKAGDRWYGDVRLATYGIAPLSKEPAVRLDARFGEGVRLRGYALADGPFEPGDIVPVTLFWEAKPSVAERYKVTVQVLNGEGRLVAQVDTEPMDGLRPTTSWRPGQLLLDRYGVHLRGDVLPGSYSLVVALYPVAGGDRLPVMLDDEPVGDYLRLCDVAVEAR